MNFCRIHIVTSVALFVSACAAETTPTLTDVEVIQRVPNSMLATEYHRRAFELLARPPPKLPAQDQDPGPYITELQDPTTELGRYARKFFNDHLAFAEAGDVSSMAMVGHAYWDGWFGTVPKDPCRALRFAFKAARQNQHLGFEVIIKAYMTGVGLPHDEQRVFFWSEELWRMGLPPPSYAASVAGEVLSVPGKLESYRQQWLKWQPQRDLEAEQVKICSAEKQGP